jgi:hypothetical protein
MPEPDSLRAEIERQAPPEASLLEASRLALAVRERGGEAVLAVVFFGSRMTQAAPDPYSAFDFFVVTSSYRAFYEALRRSGSLRRSPGLVALLNGWLPPNQIALREDGGKTWIKCSVVGLDALARETSPGRHDHFCIGRLFQPSSIVYAATPEARSAVLDAIVSAHALTFEWVRPWLPLEFTPSEYARTLLKVSLSREIRPETKGRTEELFLAQKEYLESVYSLLLRDLTRRGDLVLSSGEGFALAHEVGGLERARKELYFRWSLVRATARWAKYIVTFDGWLDYIVRKVERRTGTQIVLTSRERKFPLVFLWPRLVRFLRQKDS